MNTSTQRVAPTLRPMPNGDLSVTHRFEVIRQVGYLTVGIYEDGQPGYVHISMMWEMREKESVWGLLEDFSKHITESLQAGRSLGQLGPTFDMLFREVEDLARTSKDIRLIQGAVQYSLRWMTEQFGEKVGRERMLHLAKLAKNAELSAHEALQDTPPCFTCGSAMLRSGSHYTCPNCGDTTSGILI